MISTMTIPHMFMPGETIEAVIKKVNMHSVDPNELRALMSEFNRINGSQVPKVGMSAKIPVLQRWEAMLQL